MKNWKRVFAIIWSGQFVSLLSSTVVNFGVIIWLTIETGSAEMLAYAALAGMLPQAVLGPFSGVFIDRWDRKRIMILSDGFIAFCTLILAILFWLDIAQMWHIFISLALRSVGSAFHAPAMQASVPLLAPESQFTRVAGINQIIQSVGFIAGPALGALLITAMDIEYLLLIDVLGAAIACTSLLFIHIPNPAKKEETVKHLLHEMKEGVTAILQNRGLAWVFLFSIIAAFLIVPVSVLFPLMTKNHFGGAEFEMGLIEALWGAGTLLGGIVMGASNYKKNKVALINLMYVILGVSFLFSGLLDTGGFLWFAVWTVIGGVAGAVYQSAFTPLVQTQIDAAALGRVFSMLFSLMMIPSIFRLIGIGFFAETLGITLSFIVCGALLILIGIIAFLPRSAMSIDKHCTDCKSL